MVGVIIGRGGDNLKKIERNSGARVQIDQGKMPLLLTKRGPNSHTHTLSLFLSFLRLRWKRTPGDIDGWRRSNPTGTRHDPADCQGFECRCLWFFLRRWWKPTDSDGAFASCGFGHWSGWGNDPRSRTTQWRQNQGLTRKVRGSSIRTHCGHLGEQRGNGKSENDDRRYSEQPTLSGKSWFRGGGWEVKVPHISTFSRAIVISGLMKLVAAMVEVDLKKVALWIPSVSPKLWSALLSVEVMWRKRRSTYLPTDESSRKHRWWNCACIAGWIRRSYRRWQVWRPTCRWKDIDHSW